jgi:hypothetical protein
VMQSMGFQRGALRARITKCEICENREAVHSGLCEVCAEGIARLVSIELPEKGLYEKGLYFAAAASAA